MQYNGDLNNLKDEGQYYVVNGGATNAPSGAINFTIDIFAIYSGEYVIFAFQIMFDYNTDSGYYRNYRRSNETWSTWKSF